MADIAEVVELLADKDDCRDDSPLSEDETRLFNTLARQLATLVELNK